MMAAVIGQTNAEMTECFTTMGMQVSGAAG